MENLTLIVKKKWFDMYESGYKREDYREIKFYWIKRLVYTRVEDVVIFKKFDKIIIKNGYKKQAPTLEFQHVSTDVGFGAMALGAPKDRCFIIKMK